MTDQQQLFYETWNDVLRATVDFLGGPKEVGSMLWPEKTVSEAHRACLDCLNPERPHQFGEKEHLLISLARAKDFHLPMVWLSQRFNYAPPQPIEPQDQIAELQRQFIRAVETASGFAKLLERTRLKAVS